MNSRLIGILLFLTIPTPIIITYSFFLIQKHKIKSEIKNQMIDGIDKDNLVLLSFLSDEVNLHVEWEHSEEFKYKNEMYDIVYTQIEGDSIHYWCWWDHEETQLNQSLNELVSLFLGTDHSRKNSQLRLLDFYKSLFYSDNPPQPINTIACTIKNYHYSFNPTAICPSPLYPPPKIA